MKIRCRECNVRLEVRDELRGKSAPCPMCRAKMRLEPDPDEMNEPMKVAPAPSMISRADSVRSKPAPEKLAGDDDSFQQTVESDLIQDDFEDLPTLPTASRKSKKKKPESEATSREAAADVEQPDDVPKVKRRRRLKPTVIGMMSGVFAGPFWIIAVEQLPFIAGSLALMGAIVGFLLGLMRSTFAAGLVLYLVGIPTFFASFLTMSYPLACFWRVITSSAAGADDVEWPESSMGEWVFEMLLVCYFVTMAMLLSSGVAKLQQILIPGQEPPENYWRVLGSISEVNTIKAAPKFNKISKNIEIPIEMEVKSTRPIIDPGPAWWTTFGAMVVIFPLVVTCCLDPATPMFVPWSPRVFFSLLKKFLAWLVGVTVFGLLSAAGLSVLILGANHAPFWTFVLCSPLAGAILMFGGRLLGRLWWVIGSI